MSSKSIRYTGADATVFPEVGPVSPGKVFDVPAERVEAFTRRPDCELATAEKPPVERPPVEAPVKSPSSDDSTK